MKLLLIVFGIVLFFTFIPYIRIFCKRLSLYRRLHAACKKNGWTLSPTHRFWFLGRKNDARCDVHIVAKHDVYSVKLFAVMRRSSTLVLTGGRGYFIRGYLGLLSNIGIMATIPLDGKRCVLPEYRFREGFDASWEIKHHHKILLLSPTAFEIRRIPQYGREEIVGAGELVLDMHLYSLSRLLGRMEQLEGQLLGKNLFDNLDM